MKKTLPIITLLALAAPAQTALANADDITLPVDSRIKVLLYDESDVYTITAKYGYQTNLVFSKYEEIQTISVGDRSLWQIIPSGNRLFIRPMDDDVTTNMTVLTNRRSYQFDLKSLSDSDKDKPIYVARFKYPEDFRKPKKPGSPPPPPRPDMMPEMPPMPGMKPPPASNAGGFRPLPPNMEAMNNYNYTYAGPDALAPVKVFDDGNSTFIKHRKGTTSIPEVFVRKNGTEQAVSYYIKGDMMVVSAVAGELILRHDNQTVNVYNEMLNPR
ncbi:MAG: TrbG/VirB9 family P-type conjugative transfer protein [Rickettsiales bacterium]